MQVRKQGFPEYTRVGEALEIIASRIKEVGSEEIPFDETLGRVLAHEVESKVNVPPFDRAAMDGFAVRAEDTFGANENDPMILELIGSVRAGGQTDSKVNEGEAIEIATGAPIPVGADAVVMLENTNLEGTELEIYFPITPGRNVSSKGEDVEAGQVVLRPNRRIRPSDVGMLASTENFEVEVKEKPSVGLAQTGDELREIGDSSDYGEITETNSYALGSAVELYGGKFTRVGLVPDQVDEVENTLERVEDFDAFLFTGGTSVGEKDFIPDVISDVGELVFHGVNLRPGRPFAFGIVKNTPVFSLPGFPVAALLDFEILVRPALRVMQGLPYKNFRHQVEAELERKISSSLGRVDFVRVTLRREGDEYYANPIRVTGASILRSMTEADGFVMVPEEDEGFSEGDVVRVTPFEI